MTAFNVGDRVGWPMRDGWHFGEVLRRELIRVPDGDNGNADSLLLTLHDEETQRIIERPIRSCCAMISGEHIQEANDAWVA